MKTEERTETNKKKWLWNVVEYHIGSGNGD